MEYKAIDAFKNVQSMSHCKAAPNMKVGMGVTLNRAAKTATLPASEGDVEKVVYIATDIDDKPGLHSNPEIYVINEDEYVRADDLRAVNDPEIEFATFEINGGTTGLTAEDLLVFGTDGKIAKAASADGYTVCFKVICKTPYIDDGILAGIVAQ